MTAGCRAVLLAATAFWLAGRRLFKARSNGIGVGVFRQDGTSDRPLPVSISGADRVLVAHRDSRCVTGFHPVGSSSKQQRWRVVVRQACSALTPALAHLCAVLAVYSRCCGPAAGTGAPVAGLYRRGAACTGGAATRGSAHGPLVRLLLRLGRVWRTCSRQGILRTRWLDPRSKLYVELSRRPVRGKFGVRRHTVS